MAPWIHPSVQCVSPEVQLLIGSWRKNGSWSARRRRFLGPVDRHRRRLRRLHGRHCRRRLRVGLHAKVASEVEYQKKDIPEYQNLNLITQAWRGSGKDRLTTTTGSETRTTGVKLGFRRGARSASWFEIASASHRATAVRKQAGFDVSWFLFLCWYHIYQKQLERKKLIFGSRIKLKQSYVLISFSTKVPRHNKTFWAVQND